MRKFLCSLFENVENPPVAEIHAASIGRMEVSYFDSSRTDTDKEDTEDEDEEDNSSFGQDDGWVGIKLSKIVALWDLQDRKM